MGSILTGLYQGIPGVQHITLNRPEKNNAISYDMWVQLAELIHQYEANPACRVLVLSGEGGRAFSAGGDLFEFPTVRFHRDQAAKYNEATDEATKALYQTSLITVAAIHGFCYGGGLQLASACDVRIATMDSTFAITPARIGAVYGLYETRLLVQLVGEARAKDLLLTGRTISAADALNTGLLTMCVEADSLVAVLENYLHELLTCSKTAQQGIKEMIARIADGQLDDDAATKQCVLDSIEGADYHQRVLAFIEQRRR